MFFLNLVFFILFSSAVYPAYASECDDIVEKLQAIVDKLEILEQKLAFMGSDSPATQQEEKSKNISDNARDDEAASESLQGDGMNLSKKLFSSRSSEKELYDQAYILMKNGNYRDAESNFHSFISIFPNSRFVPNAHYWIADINYYTKNFRNAAVYFVKAYTADPTGVKAPVSLFKLADSLNELKDTTHSCSILSKLFRSFPDLVYSLKTQACALGAKIKCEKYEGFCM